jgi:hypothetical protein
MDDKQRSPEFVKLTAQCLHHGTVHPVCPKCAGKVGGKRHAGTQWRGREELQLAREELAMAERVLEAYYDSVRRMHECEAQARAKYKSGRSPIDLPEED